MIDGRTRQWLERGAFLDWAPSNPRGRANTLSIFHAEFGEPDAPVLLLLHGFPTSSIDWFDVADALSREHRVCVLDVPGFGFSDKPHGERYTIARDRELVEHYLSEVLGARTAAVVAHDRGDSVALALAARCASGDAPFELSHLAISNGNVFLPLSNLTAFQRLVLDATSAPELLAALTPAMLAAGMGESVFTPPRAAQDPVVASLAETFAFNDGIAVLHDTIQYLVERSENEQDWLEALGGLQLPTTLVWGLYDTVAPLRVAAHVWNAYLATKPGENAFWLLPRANHYPQHDQPREFVQVIASALAGSSPQAPGPLSSEPGAPILIDRSRTALPNAKEVLASSASLEDLAARVTVAES
ncbi:MAG: alpha/beta fold hydrolase [Solirubrobacteraceae bacterium]